MSDTEILATVFKPEPCDFCPATGPVYIDPETQGRFCLDCLVIASEPLIDEPTSPEESAFGRKVFAEWQAARANF